MRASSPKKDKHTIVEISIFNAKAVLLRIKRAAENLLDKKHVKFPKAEKLSAETLLAESKTPLWTESRAEEQFLLAGKVHNLRIAIAKLDGVEIPAGETFSFWKQVGRAGRFRGFVEGRELREGCIIPNVGGGLCQLSNALYDAALKANFEIVERHPHTQVIPGSLAERGRDATVFWNYLDLRFRAPAAFRIEARLGKDHLRVQFKGEKRNGSPKLFHISPRANAGGHAPNSCATCGVESCFRSLKPEETNLNFGRAAFLLDEFSPEFDAFIQRTRTERDILFVPLDGTFYRKANYAWNTSDFARVRQSYLTTLLRAYRSRKLAAQGAARQRNLLQMAERLAQTYAENLSYDALHVVVSQNLLPFLWKNGHLGGRTFDVLMTALPMRELQKRLDRAAALHPESTTLGDFRADESLVEAETEALENASKIVTPHTEIAALFGNRSELLDWNLPAAKNISRKRSEKFTIVFPASTVGRKGCYELREAIRFSDVKLVTLGANIEGADFWNGFDREKGAGDWLEKADLVVLPAFVEHRPRRLLQAAANKIPVVASSACGVKNIEGVANIEAGDVESLRSEIRLAIQKSLK